MKAFLSTRKRWPPPGRNIVILEMSAQEAEALKRAMVFTVLGLSASAERILQKVENALTEAGVSDRPPLED